MALIEVDLNHRSSRDWVAPRSYSTSFGLTENPISESGNWSSRDTNRTRMRTSGGVAYGTQVGGAYDDSYAYVNGVWAANTEVVTTVFKGSTSGIMEIEHLHRCTDSSSIVHCYEINVAHDGSYVDIISWDGDTTLPSFTYMIATGTYYVNGGVSSGYKFRTRCIGNVISVAVNRNDGNGFVAVNGGDGSGSAADTRNSGGAMWTTGCPGIGAFKTSGSGSLNQWALTDFTAVELP